jgi:hypothetical protein
MPEFRPEYPGDTPNRKWVRDRMASKGIGVDYADVILHMPAVHVRWLFGAIVSAEWPEARF